MTDIKIDIENGEAAVMPAATTVGEALSELLSNKQRKRTVAVYLDEQILDLSTPLTSDASLSLIQIGSDESLAILRHSTAHVMAEAVRELYGSDVKVAIGPSIDDGFYYDFERSEAFTPQDFEQIEAKMTEIVRKAQPFTRTEIKSDEAIKRFEAEGEKYKVELIKDLDTESVTLYQQGDFTDLCRGPHLPNTSWIKAFKLQRVAGAYWRGDEKNTMLQRIYGTAFFDKKALKKHLNALEEAKKETIENWVKNCSSSPFRMISGPASFCGSQKVHSFVNSSKITGKMPIIVTTTSYSTPRILHGRTSGRLQGISISTLKTCTRAWISMMFSISSNR